MRVSYFADAQDRYPKQEDFTWESFVAALDKHEYRPVGVTPEDFQRAKEGCPCFSPAEYPEDTPRGKKNVTRVWLAVLDVDGYPEDKLNPSIKPKGVTYETVDALRGFLQQLGLAAVFYSTWSHARAWTEHGRCKFRVIIPLDVPVDAEHWPSFWLRFNDMFGGLCDGACKDASRLYFGPYAPMDTEQYNFFWVLPGAPLSVSSVMQRVLPEGVVDETTDVQDVRARDVEAVTLLAQAWPEQRRHEAHRALAGGLLSSGFTDERAVDFLCAVARAQDPHNEDRDKRQALVEHTRAELNANERITGWATLSTIVGDVVDRVRDLVERAKPITLEQVERYAKTLKRSKIDQKAELGDAMLLVCQKRVFPESLALKLAAELGHRFHDLDPHSIAMLFEQSLSVMRAEGEDVTVEQVEARIKAKQDEVKQHRRELAQKKEQQEQALEYDKSSRIAEAYKNGRTNPYTAQELQAWAPMIATGHRWILQKDRYFYFFFNGSYRGPFSETEAHGAALRELSPASSAGVNIYQVKKDGTTDFKSLKHLIAEYGTVVERIINDLRAQIITYDEQERAIVAAPCPLRKLEPRYDPDVDQWLFLMTGGDPNYTKVKTWLSLLPNLDIIRAALFLWGAHSVGKSMLGQSGSRLWTTQGPTTLIQAFANFNDSILRCPYIFADEYLPKDIRGKAPTEELRAFVAAQERPLNIKHQPSSKLLGVTPLQIAGHDLDVIRPTENISNAEVAGSIERFLIVPVREEAAYFLANLRPSTHERAWIDSDVVARHIWWLAYNHPHKKEGRFYFAPQSAEYAMWFATSSGAKSSILRWLTSFLADRQRFEGDANTLMLVRVYQGRLLVNVRGITNFWDKYIGNEHCPNMGTMARLIGEISEEKRVKLKDGTGQMTNYRVILPDYLYTWARNTDIITIEQIDAQLAKDSEETSVGLTIR